MDTQYLEGHRTPKIEMDTQGLDAHSRFIWTLNIQRDNEDLNVQQWIKCRLKI